MKIICISGKAGHGKDTTAEILKEFLATTCRARVLIAHYGDLLKYICKTFLSWNGKKDEEGRELLQYVGTDVIRAHSPDYFVDFLVSFARLFLSEWDYMLIPDTRFENEITRWREEGFDVVHLRVIGNSRRNMSELQKRHISECALDGITPDIVIDNTGSLNDLRERVSGVVDRICG